MEKANSTGMSSVRIDFLRQGFSNSTVDILMDSWRVGTEKQYEPALKKWLNYCKKGINPYDPSLPDALHFLSELFNQGCSYDQIKTARSALSSIIRPTNNITFGRLPIVKRFMKGIYEKRPSFPKNYFVWDVSILLNYFRSSPNVEQMSLKHLSQKLVLLMSIVSGGQRVQTLHSIVIENINVLPNKIIIPITSKLKQSKPSKHMAPLVFEKYNEDLKICVVHHLLCYLERTEPLHQSSNLFISYLKPYKAVPRDTISRWCKTLLQAAGINTKMFIAHSSRSAAS